MSKCIVSIPIAGAIHVEVDAASEKAAKEAAWDIVNEKGEKAGEVEWEFLDAITTGNVCHAPLNEIEAKSEHPATLKHISTLRGVGK